ncbi:TPA: radical SAM protein [Candidatus Woesearchaeota archaeon]|nr:radical SAM protein [Candidatus Woesearchaeota archaeon]HII69405.1 radical SAM protein [Candidatus Woesearchaeota archaeon]
MLKPEDISVEERKEHILRFTIYSHFYKDIPEDEVREALGPFEIADGKLRITNLPHEHSDKKLIRLIGRYTKNLTYRLNGNRAIYADENMGMPLIGLNFLGILDKGSEILEIKPITNCNANCVFCSVNEGPGSSKEIDFVVDVHFLIAETKALLAYKGARDMRLWLNPHGEPTLYPKLAEYCDAMLADEHVRLINIITNGMLLTKPLVDLLHVIMGRHGKEISLSVSLSGISSVPQEKSKHNKKGLGKARQMMGESYNLNLVMRNVAYAARQLPLRITPVLVAGMNEDEMPGIISLAKRLAMESDKDVEVIIQKFCKNKRGRNPIKEEQWEPFFDFLKELQDETGIQLIRPLGKIQETKELPELCRKGDSISVKIICEGRYRNDRLGVYATMQGARAVALIGCAASKGLVKAMVVSSKYNMIVARC